MITDDGYKATKDGYKKVGISIFNYRFWNGYYEKRTATDGCYVSVSKIALIRDKWRQLSSKDKKEFIAIVFQGLGVLLLLSFLIGGAVIALVHLIKNS